MRAAQPTARSRGTQSARSAVASRTTAGTDTSWVNASGTMPDSRGTWPMQANRSPNPSPASTPSSRPSRSGADSCSGVGGTEETSQIAGAASTMPSQTRPPGRSPPTTPKSTGTRAAPTAETGATTLIRPVAKPR